MIFWWLQGELKLINSLNIRSELWRQFLKYFWRNVFSFPSPVHETTFFENSFWPTSQGQYWFNLNCLGNSFLSKPSFPKLPKGNKDCHQIVTKSSTSLTHYHNRIFTMKNEIIMIMKCFCGINDHLIYSTGRCRSCHLRQPRTRLEQDLNQYIA